MKRVYCDTNVVVAFFIEENGSRAIEELLKGSDIEPFVSHLVLLEVVSTFGRLVRERQISAEQAAELIVQLDRWADFATVLPMSVEMFGVARRFLRRFDLGLRAPDSLHLAFARSANLPLATFDQKLLRAADALSIPVLPLTAGA